MAVSLGLADQKLRELRRDFWLGERLDGTLASFILGLRPRYKTAILSNAWSDARKVFIREYGIDKIVDSIIISAEEGIAKPDVRIYQIAAQKLSVQPWEALFVDDMAENVRGARAAGMWNIHFLSTEQTIREVHHCITRAAER